MYYQNLFKDRINGILMTDAIASTSYVSYNNGKWKGLLPTIEPEFDDHLLTHPNEFESFINRLKNQKLVVTDIFVFYYAPLTTLRAVPLFVYQSSKGNADEKTDYLLLHIEEELEKEDLHVVAKAFDADPGYLKYVRKTMLYIRNLMLEQKLNFFGLLPISNLFISDPAHLLKRFRRLCAFPSRKIINCDIEITCANLDSILNLNYTRMWDLSPQSKLNDFYPAVLFTHENAIKVIQSNQWPYIFSFLPQCCLNITIRCHNISRFQRSRLLILGFFIMFIHYETLIDDDKKKKEKDVWPEAIIIQYLVTTSAIISIFMNIFDDFGLDRIGSLILEHFFGKLRQICKDQHIDTLLRGIQDLLILDLIRDEKQDLKIPKRNFDTARSGFGKVNFEDIEIEQIYIIANMICKKVNQKDLGFVDDSLLTEENAIENLIKLFTFQEGTYLYKLRPSTANQKINAQSNIINRFISQKVASQEIYDKVALVKDSNIDYNKIINEQYSSKMNDCSINISNYLLQLKGNHGKNLTHIVEEEEDMLEEWNASDNNDDTNSVSTSSDSEFDDIEEIENSFAQLSDGNDAYCINEYNDNNEDEIEIDENEKLIYDYYKFLGIERKNNLPLCYLIVCLQIFLNNKEFNDILDNLEIPENTPLLREYLTIRNKLPRNIMPFYDLIKTYNVRYTHDTQEDTMEMFQLLFTLFADEFSEIDNDSVFKLRDLFCIEVKYITKCNNCSASFDFYDFSNCFVIKLSSENFLENLSNFFINEEREPILCDNCHERTDCKEIKKKLKYKTMPTYLIFHLARFKYSNRVTKIHIKMEFPLYIDQESLNLKSSISYLLHQVIYHDGSGQQGHYYTDILLHDEEIIIRFNDEKIQILKNIDLNSTKAYVLIYKRIC